MNKKLLTGLITGGAILTTVASAYAFGPNNFQSIKTALDNNDYSSWVSAITDTPNSEDILSKVNESNFSQLVEANQLMESGDRDGAQAIYEELGINGLMGKGGQNRNNLDSETIAQMDTAREAVETALVNNDYEAWKEAVSQLPNSEDLLNKITADNFDRLVEAYNLEQQSKAILDELDVKGLGLGGLGHGPGNGGHGMMNNDSTDTSSTN